MLNFGELFAHVSNDVLLKAARRTQDTLQQQSVDWALCRGDWRIEEHIVEDSVILICLWSSAWEIDWEDCQSTTEARAFIELTYESELYCRDVMSRMIRGEQARIVTEWLEGVIQLPLPIPVAV